MATPDSVIIRQLTPNVTTLSIPFLRFGVLRVGMRTTIIKLPSGALAVISPIARTPSIIAKVEALGNNVAYLMAPDLEHHMFLGEWAAAFPSAKLVGPAGMAEKEPQLTFSTIFTQNGQKVSPEFDAEFEYVFAAEHATKELVFFFRKDKAIILADFMFNLPAKEQFSQTVVAERTLGQNIATNIFAGIMNTQGEAIWQKRFLWYASGNGRDSITASAKIMDAWDFDTIVVAHGDVIVGDGKKVFEKLFAWHLEEEKKSI